jgi:MFS superfamily sulfate permease-like transporter
VLGAIPGFGLAIAIAVLEFLWDGWRPHSAVITRYPNARQIPGLILFRWDAPLFFANAEFFKERILDAVAKSPSPVRWVVVAAEPVTLAAVILGVVFPLRRQECTRSQKRPPSCQPAPRRDRDCLQTR